MSELAAIAKRVVWYQAPDATLENRKLFLAHVMTYGTLDEIRAVRREWGERCFAEVLDDPPPGIFDPRSWVYWNLVLDRDPSTPLPVRQIPGV